MGAGLPASEGRRSGERRRPRDAGLCEREVLRLVVAPLVPLDELLVPLEELEPLERLVELDEGERDRAGMVAGCGGLHKGRGRQWRGF